MKQTDLKIKKFVYKIRGRLREQSIIDYLLRFVVMGLSAALITSVISLFVPFYYAVLLATVIVIAAFITGIVLGIKKTPAPMEAALRADAKGYKEKISTAFFLNGREDVFSKLLKDEVGKIADSFVVRKEFPLHISWNYMSVVIVLAVLFAAASLKDTPAKERAAILHTVKKEAKDEIAQLEKVEKAIAENREISENEIADIKEQLENAKKELAEADSREKLKKASERISKKMEQKSEQTGNKTLSETLNQAAKEADQRIADKDKELAKAAREAMEKAAKGSKKEKQEAYKKLKDLAENLGDEELKQAAENYKDSQFSDSDYAAAQSAMNNAVSKMQENTNVYANNTFNQNNNPNSSSNYMNNTQSSSQATVSNKNNQSGTQNAQNANQGQSGSGSQQGNGQGSGAGNGNSAGNGQGSGAGSGSGWNYGSKNGKEGARKTGEDITVPSGELGNDGNLTGKANGNDSSTKSTSNQANTWSGDKVNYGQVSGKYKDKAYKKINGSNYPGRLKDKIKNYFDGLN